MAEATTDWEGQPQPHGSGREGTAVVMVTAA